MRSNVDSTLDYDIQRSSPQSPRPRMVVVIGLYKSGTSIMAQLVQAMGFKPMDDLWQDYVQGVRQSYLTYESVVVNSLNDRIIHGNGGRLDRPPLKRRPAGVRKRGENKRSWEAEILRILSFHQGVDSVIKDPRFCITLSTWLPVIEKMWQPILIWVKRQRTALVQSWFKDPWCRQCLRLTSEQRALTLVADYEDHLDRNFRTYAGQYTSHEVNLENFRNAPQKNVLQLARFLDCQVNTDTIARLIKS